MDNIFKTNNKIVYKVVTDLLDRELIPFNQKFSLDETHLYSYVKLYSYYKHNVNGKFDYGYARKLAGLTFVKLKKSWGQSSKDFKEGFIYCIKNEAWPGFTKVGITYDINNRLNTYQTGDPFRSYKIAYYDFVLDRKQTERDIFSKFKINIHNG